MIHSPFVKNTDVQITRKMYEDEDYEDFATMYHQDEEEHQWFGLFSVLKDCLIPTVSSICAHMLHLLTSCLLFRLSTQTIYIPLNLRHMSSALFGLYSLYYFFEELVVDILVLVGGAFFVLVVLDHLKMKKGLFMSFASIFYLMCNELYHNPEQWQKVRGPEMLVVMKVVSIAFDMDANVLQQLPNCSQYCGYVLCVGTSVFGAWVSYDDYQNIFHDPPWNVSWILKAARSMMWSMFFFMMSVCLIEWLIPPESALWWGMYREALQFRTSHYFVSYLSEAAAVLSGFGAQSNEEWIFNVSEPYYIELPHSLVQVVIYWNKHMHKWLKNYVFRTSIQYGSLTAVLMTYTISSLLHGMNVPIAAVLMSLGVYTYAEYSVRQRLSSTLNACVAARPCPKHCTRHMYTARLLPVAVFNWFWSALAVFHLAYLGCIIDTSDTPTAYPQVFEKWINMHYISHWVALLTFIVCFFLNRFCRR